MFGVIAVSLGVSFPTVVSVATAYFVCYGLSQPVWGVLADRFGRVHVLVASLTGAGVSGLVSALSPNEGFLLVSRSITGAFFGGVVPAVLTYVGDTTPSAERQHRFTQVLAAISLGGAASSLGAGVLADLELWRLAFAITGLAALVGAVLVRSIAEPERARGELSSLAGLWRVVTNKWFVVLFSLTLIEGGVLFGVLSFIAPAVEHAGGSASLAGAMVAVYGVGVIASTQLVGVLGNRRAPWELLVPLQATFALFHRAQLPARCVGKPRKFGNFLRFPPCERTPGLRPIHANVT